MSKLIDIKQELESLMPYLEGSTQGEAVKFCIRILGERWEVGQQRDRLAEALRTALEWIPQTMQGEARAALAEFEGKEGV